MYNKAVNMLIVDTTIHNWEDNNSKDSLNHRLIREKIQLNLALNERWWNNVLKKSLQLVIQQP